MSYLRKLQNPLWQKKRLLIMQRDEFKCVECGANDRELQVHHEKYIPHREPWEYPDELLITLCHVCHEKKSLPQPKQPDEKLIALSITITGFVVMFYTNQLHKTGLTELLNGIDANKMFILNALTIALKSDKLRQLANDDGAFYIKKSVEILEVRKEFMKAHNINAVVLAA